MVARCILTAGLLATLLWSGSGATLHDKDAQLIRSESRSTNKIVKLSPHGELIAEGESPPDQKVVAVQERAEEMGQSKVASEDEFDSGDYCRYDFPLGLADKDDCGSKSTQNYSLVDADKCKWAAQEAHAEVEDGKFHVKELGWEKVHPRGCFKDHCVNDQSKVCYFHNEGDNSGSANLTGQPVCQRPRYMNGAISESEQDANVQEAKCDDAGEYSVIMDEDECKKAANCQGYCLGHEFRPAAINDTVYDDFPEGCFIHATVRNTTADIPCVYFNERNPTLHTAPPASPVGTPICKVTSSVDFSR